MTTVRAAPKSSSVNKNRIVALKHDERLRPHQNKIFKRTSSQYTMRNIFPKVNKILPFVNINLAQILVSAEIPDRFSQDE